MTVQDNIFFTLVIGIVIGIVISYSQLLTLFIGICLGICYKDRNLFDHINNLINKLRY